MQNYDYIVIGAGSAGCVLASRLSENPHHQVALLEAGGADDSVLIHCPAGLAGLARSARFNWAMPTVPQPGLGGRCGHHPRGRVLGGSSSINAMIYLRGQPQDYDGWAALGNPGWSWAEVLPYFQRAEDRALASRAADPEDLRIALGQGGPLQVADLMQPNALSQAFVQAGMEAGLAPNPGFNGAQQEGVGLYQVTQKDGERHSVAKAYLTPHLGRPNLHVYTGTRVLRLLLDSNEGRLRALGVECARAGQTLGLMAQREVLLSAGALLSPQLLLLSGIGPAVDLQAHGITPRLDLPGVGHHLQDHLDTTLVYDHPGLTQTFGLSAAGLWHLLRDGWEWQRRRSGPLTTNFAEAGAFLRSSPELAQPDLQLHFVVAKLIDHGRRTLWGHGYSCHVCVLHPASRGQVRLASADPWSLPAVDPNYLHDPRDLERLVLGVQRMRSILSQPALAGFGARETAPSAGALSTAQIEAFIRGNADTIYHPVGTCRMGPGPLDVVDAQLRVHGVAGLRVVDASVFPTITSGNTNAPTVMVAEKAAELLAREAATA